MDSSEVCLLKPLRELYVSVWVQLIQYICFLTSCILQAILLDYWLVRWLNLLAVVCVSSILHTQCCSAVCADGNPRDSSFKTWQWMQQQQSPLLTADKDAESQLLSFRLSWVTGCNRRDEWWNRIELDSHLLHLLNTRKNPSMLPSCQASSYTTSGPSNLRSISGVCVLFLPHCIVLELTEAPPQFRRRSYPHGLRGTKHDRFPVQGHYKSRKPLSSRANSRPHSL